MKFQKHSQNRLNSNMFYNNKKIRNFTTNITKKLSNFQETLKIILKSQFLLKIMHTQQFSRPGVEEFMQEQKQYSNQQMKKISHSNRKLDELEQKMKKLLGKDTRKNNQSRYLNVQFDQRSDQIDRYFQSSKKYNHRISSEQQLNENEDLLLQNNNFEENPGWSNKIQNFVYKKHTNTVKKPQNQPQSQSISTKRQKSSSVLKIFGNKNSKPSQKSQKNVQKPITNAERNKSGNFDVKQSKKANNFVLNNDQLPQSPHFGTNCLNIQKCQSIPSQQLKQINQLEQMMLKSLQIKQRQLALKQEQNTQFQQNKLKSYRQSIQLQLELQNIKKFNQQLIFLIKNQIHPRSSLANNSKTSEQPLKSEKQKIIYEQLSRQKNQLKTQSQKLIQELKSLDQQHFKIKLQSKRQNFQFNSLQRQFKALTKNKKIKQNILSNLSNQQFLNEIQQQPTQNHLANKNPSIKKLKTHKKKSSSFQQLKCNNKYCQKVNQGVLSGRIKTKNPLILSQNRQILSENRQILSNNNSIKKQKQRTPCKCNLHYSVSCQNRAGSRNVSRSASLSVMAKNRHMLSSCQSTVKNCGADKILYAMVNELDKLKQIVSKQIVKTQKRTNSNLNANSTTKRRVIDLYNSTTDRDKPSAIR